jgi:2-polyprenyl-3-methyl-5-hydroxy-6-metoxy-1,4-benzoquinol methylase
MKSGSDCPICNSAYTLYVQDVVGERTEQLHPQRFCMDCKSFFHRSGYRETDLQKQRDFEFLFADRENHSAIQNQLTSELVSRLPGARSVLEIGHGLGLFLKAFQDFGLSATGFEVNKYCSDFAVDHLKVDSRLGMFDDSHEEKYDLIVALQVFEHLEDPRDLFALMARHLNPDGAIYISVPFVEREQWRFLRTAGQAGTKHPADVFAHNDVHITHFSVEGMKRMGLGLGARSAEYFVSKDVYHHSPGAYQGVLFKY